MKDTIVVNDRWGHVNCAHGDYFDCSDRFHPCESVNHILNWSKNHCAHNMRTCLLRAAVLQKHKYESGATIDRASWGFRRNTKFTDFLTIENLIWQLVSTVR